MARGGGAGKAHKPSVKDQLKVVEIELEDKVRADAGPGPRRAAAMSHATRVCIHAGCEELRRVRCVLVVLALQESQLQGLRQQLQQAQAQAAELQQDGEQDARLRGDGGWWWWW